MKISRKHGRILAYTILALVILWVTWISWVKFSPKPLGDGLVYLETHNDGLINPLVDRPADHFFYATDLTLDEIMYSYFNKGEVVSGPNSSPYTDSGTHWTMIFQNKDNGKKFYLGFYQDGKYFANNKKLEIGDKKYIVEIKDRDNYNAAKDSL